MRPTSLDTGPRRWRDDGSATGRSLEVTSQHRFASVTSGTAGSELVWIVAASTQRDREDNAMKRKLIVKKTITVALMSTALMGLAAIPASS